jgi:hypothetical protein
MIKGGVGGANTQTGLKFEKRVDILTILAEREGYTIKGRTILYDGKEIANSYKKSQLYKFLDKSGVKHHEIISKKLLPDDAIHVLESNTLFVIEMKFQRTEGSVDEKLQTCDFKKRQYNKLLSPLGIKVEYIYVLSDWFKNPKYKNVLDYIEEVGCYYYFENLPLEKIGLPTSKV